MAGRCVVCASPFLSSSRCLALWLSFSFNRSPHGRVCEGCFISLGAERGKISCHSAFTTGIQNVTRLLLKHILVYCCRGVHFGPFTEIYRCLEQIKSTPSNNIFQACIHMVKLIFCQDGKLNVKTIRERTYL